MENDKRLGKKSIEKNLLYRDKENSWDEIIKHNESWRKFTEKYAGFNEIKKNIISENDEARKFLANLEKDSDYGSNLSFTGPTFNLNEVIEIVSKENEKKEIEKLRRHNENIEVGKEQVVLLTEQNDKLKLLLQISQNSNEQRDAVIYFIVQMLVHMEASPKEKERTLSGILTRIASFTAIGADLSSIYEFVANEIKGLAKED